MDPIQQLIAQLTQQYAGGIGPIQRGTDPYDGSLNRYADMNIGGQQRRLMYQPGMESGLPEGGRAPGRFMTGLTDRMTHPTTGKAGAVRGFFGEDGSFQGAEWWNDEQSWVDKVLSVAPALVLGAAALGAGGFLPGMAGETAAAAGGGQAAAFTPGMTAGPAMSTIPGAGGSAISIPGLTTSGVNAGAMSHMAGSLGADLIAAGVVPGFSGTLASEVAALAGPLAAQVAPAAAQAAQAPQAGSMGGAAAPGAGATQAAGGAGILDTMKSLATYAGPAASLLGAAQTVGAVNDLQASMPALRQPEAPPVPAARANPAARGYQAASNPITSVLGRNRDANRNRTMLTGPRGVNMDSVRVGGNTLLGM